MERENLHTQDSTYVKSKASRGDDAGYVMAKDYYLTVPCMEFFITCKVRPVFEVYHTTILWRHLIPKKAEANEVGLGQNCPKIDNQVVKKSKVKEKGKSGQDCHMDSLPGYSQYIDIVVIC